MFSIGKSNLGYRIGLMVLFCTFLTSCVNEDTKTIPKLEEKIIKSYNEIEGDLKIIINSLQDSKHHYYDTCYNNNLLETVNENQNEFKIAFVDLDFLNFVSKNDSTIKRSEIEKWHFIRSENFNQLLKLDNNNEKENCRKAWQNIYDNRYVMLLEYRRKIMPRTNFEHYVLGGMFQGGIYLYDLHDLKTICYYSIRFNNTSNKKEYYKKYDSDIAKGMELELIEQMKLKIKLALTEKTGVEKINLDL